MSILIRNIKSLVQVETDHARNKVAGADMKHLKYIDDAPAADERRVTEQPPAAVDSLRLQRRRQQIGCVTHEREGQI